MLSQFWAHVLTDSSQLQRSPSPGTYLPFLLRVIALPFQAAVASMTIKASKINDNTKLAQQPRQQPKKKQMQKHEKDEVEEVEEKEDVEEEVEVELLVKASSKTIPTTRTTDLMRERKQTQQQQQQYHQNEKRAKQGESGGEESPKAHRKEKEASPMAQKELTFGFKAKRYASEEKGSKEGEVKP